ncbi:MAG: glycosyl transferase [Cycloclasticus sp.]|nr:glycosyl transferase [Cycloclasticus sp.]MBG97203.1 glycosyl transferase [Cycloclasticus sp.]|tara:strand:- start:754 stop:1623 length:870 start_codon:yes stop_codon:yes gene_type:complete
MTTKKPYLSIVMPCLNEAENIDNLLPKIKEHQPDAEILVVDDGSTDRSLEICKEHGVKVVSHPASLGNGAAIKTGARNAIGEIIVFMDADGQHAPEDIQRLLSKLEQGYDMVVGARQSSSHASKKRLIGNTIFNKLASFMTGQKIEDLTSGFRAVRAKHFKKFLYLLPNGFSYPTTSTMAFFRSALPVAYIPIHAGKREGKSKIKLLNDGFRFFVIILKIGALFSPMRLFLPVSVTFFILGVINHIDSYLSAGTFSNGSLLLYTSSVFIFLMGILSEQISSLHYRNSQG